MKKILKILLPTLIIFSLISVVCINLLFFSLATHVYADERTSIEIAQDITGAKFQNDKINVIFFHGDGCPHCADEEKFIKKFQIENDNILNIIDYEVWYNKQNEQYFKTVMTELKIAQKGVPLTIIGNKYFVGFSNTVKAEINKALISAMNEQTASKMNPIFRLPFLGDINAKEISIPLVATILGFVDGFNPCAMWVLLFLINMLLDMENKKKKWTIGLVFLGTSAFVYLLSMLGINLILNIISVSYIKLAIALAIFVFGILNIRKYIKTRKLDDGCVVVDKKKRKKISKNIKEITTQKNFWLAIIGVMLLAVNVNLVELSCSLGFPVVFNEILTINLVSGATKFFYMLIYIFFYMIDDIVVFTISMVTLEATGITNKYNKICTLVSGIIMTLMGILLIIKPEWLMFNF